MIARLKTCLGGEMILRDGIRIVTSAIGVIDSIRVCLCETVMMRLFVLS